jgi:hypothetical protein
VEYRGIKLVDSVKLYQRDGQYFQKIKKGLDILADILMNNNHEILSEYKENHDKVLIDFKCGHQPNWIKPSNYKNGRGCPECGIINRAEKRSKQTKEEFPLLVEGNGHKWVKGDYVNARVKVCIDFNCGHVPHWITPDNYKRGYGCPKCAGTCQDQARDNLTNLANYNGHLILSEYVKDSDKILINYKCGHEPHWVIVNNYKKGSGCPVCSETKGEKRIRKWLEEKNIKFIPQKEYDGLVGTGGGNLSYDFYLPNKSILIEYQGEFHDGSSGDYSKINLQYQKEHDERKKEYAKLNNINLLEIWYWDFENIEEILINKLNK